MTAHPLASGLTKKILIGLGAGAIFGLLANMVLSDIAFIQTYVIDGLLDVVGKLFVQGLQMLVVPLVLVSLICGASSLASPAKLGRLGGKALGLYLLTTALAVTFAMILALAFSPGAGIALEAANYTPKEAPGIKEVILNLVPKNPVAALAEGKMLAIIIFAILFGVAITMAGDAGKRVRDWFGDMNEVIMSLVVMVMKVAPYGVFALIAGLFAKLGWEAFQPVLKYFFVVLGGLLIHLFVTYPALLKGLTGLNPMLWLRKMRNVQIFAFSTASSNATIPVTLRAVEERLGANNSVASFTVPLGATINMDGTAIMQGVATVFIAQAYGFDLSVMQLVTVVLMATMASIGTAGVPGVGLIMLTTVLVQVGLPVEGIGLILGIDRVLDMVRTAVNVSGDAMVTTVVANSEGELDRELYNNPDT
ncbi:MAG: sodium:dicarboxylate symporter [Lysobacteraceae bacterium]|nr:MAG: sodium:dicarboxylate symporter [Xanthomonadaceae bacterium]